MRLLQLCLLLYSAHITNAGFRVLGHWFLDGTDTDISLHNGPTYAASGGADATFRTLQFTKDQSYARLPAINLKNRNFTIACWIKLAVLDERKQTIYSDWFVPWNFGFYVKKDLLCFQYHKDTNRTNWSTMFLLGGKVRQKRWMHVAVTMDRLLRKGVLYVNAIETDSGNYDENDQFYDPIRETFQIGDTGHPSNEQLYGEVMDLYVLDQALSQRQLRHLKGMRMESQLFHSDVGFALQSHVFQTENHVTECSQCMFLCRLHEECVSFNFNQRGQVCELNDARKDADPANHKPTRADFVYYEQSGSKFF